MKMKYHIDDAFGVRWASFLNKDERDSCLEHLVENNEDCTYVPIDEKPKRKTRKEKK